MNLFIFVRVIDLQIAMLAGNVPADDGEEDQGGGGSGEIMGLGFAAAAPKQEKKHIRERMKEMKEKNVQRINERIEKIQKGGKEELRFDKAEVEGVTKAPKMRVVFLSSPCSGTRDRLCLSSLKTGVR